MRISLLSWILVLVSLNRSQAQIGFNFHTDTIQNWPERDYYYIEPFGDKYLVNRWNKRHCTALVNADFTAVPSYYFDTVLKPMKSHGIVTADRDGGYYRANYDYMYHYSAQTQKEKRLTNLNFRHLGKVYTTYGDFYNPHEGLKLNYDAVNQHVLVQAKPRLYRFLTGHKRPEKDFYDGRALWFALNEKGKITGTYGRYDSVYFRHILPEAALFYGFVNEHKGEILITQKASAQLQVWDLKTYKLVKIVQLNTEKMRGSLQHYQTLKHDSSREMKFRVLIESPSFGDVFYSKANRHYYVLRSDSIPDTTWHTQPSNFMFEKSQSVVVKPQKKRRGCGPLSDQLRKQFRVYNKRVFLQVYDEQFRFLGEFPTPFVGLLRFIKEKEGRIYLYWPSASCLIYSFEEGK